MSEFDNSAGGNSSGDDPIKAREHVEAYSEAGTTWWVEFVLPEVGEGEGALMRIRQGAPR